MPVNQAVHERLLRSLLLIRRAEERIAQEYPTDRIKSPVHLSIGQEAVAVGVCDVLNADDLVAMSYRGHAAYLAKGGSLRAMIAELYGKATGCAHGKGGSMHLVAPEVGVLGTVPLVAATIPIGVGAALASKLRGERRVSVPFFGVGATEEGHFHESLNLAANFRLPVVFVCENNLYSSHMHINERRAEDNIQIGRAHV